MIAAIDHTHISLITHFLALIAIALMAIAIGQWDKAGARIFWMVSLVIYLLTVWFW